MPPSPRLTRRRLLGATATSLALASVGCSRQQPATPPARDYAALAAAVRDVTDEQLRGVTVRVIDGLFGLLQLAPAGLADTPYKIEFLAGSVSDQLALLLSGRADLNVFGDLSFAGIIAADAPVKIVRALQRPTRSCGIVVPTASPVRTLADLKGRQVANTTGFSSELVALRAFREAGLDFFRDTRVVELKNLADARTAFVGGKVDAWVGCTTVMVSEVLEGRARLLVNGDAGRWIGHNYWGAHDAVFDDPVRLAAVLDYIRRTDRSFEWANQPAHVPQLAGLMATLLHADREQTERFLHWSGPSHGIPVTPAVIDGLQATYDDEAALGRIPPGRQVAPYFTAAFNDWFDAPRGPAA